ncbi:MAG: response regulator [Bacteroidales bacterium]
MKWFKYFKHPLFIGFVLSAIAIFALARIFPLQHFEISHTSDLNPGDEIYFCDIDDDGNSESINFYASTVFFNPTLSIYNSDSSLMAYWNFFDFPVKNSRLFFGDYNQNGIKEIFLFTQDQDSVFIYIVNPKDDKRFLVKRRFITTLRNQNSAYRILPIGLLNNHSTPEKVFYFALSYEHPELTDRIFGYDIANDNLFHSDDLRAQIIHPIVVNDINGDGIKEILISVETKENRLSKPLTQLWVFNHQLEYFFKPYTIEEAPTRLFVDVLETTKDKYIIALSSRTENNNVFHSLFLFDKNGECIAEQKLDWETHLVALDSELSEEYFTLFSGKHILEINADLEMDIKKRLTRKNALQFLAAQQIGIDSPEKLFFTADSSLYIFSADYKIMDKLSVANHEKSIFSVKRLRNDPDIIAYQAGKKLYFINYFKNMAYLTRYLIYLTLFILITFAVFLVTKFLHKRWLKKNNNKTRYNQLTEKFNDDGNLLAEDDVDYRTPYDSAGKVLNAPTDLKNMVQQITSHFNFKMVTTFYPNGEWYEINQHITKTIGQFLEDILSSLSDIDQKLSLYLSIIRHKDYLNILIELPDSEAKDFSILKNDEMSNMLKDVKGEVELDYSEGIGTIINIYIPLVIQSKSTKQKIRIIIAEDHDVSLFGLVTLFKNKSDIEIVGTAKNGMEVLQILESKKVDIVITDISMPGMDGIELAEQLRNDYPAIKVIVFTMYMENWFIEQLIKHGAKGFVAKNSKINELINAVYNVYEGNNYYCPQFKSKYGFNAAEKKEVTLENQLDSLNSDEKKIMDLYADNLNKIKISELLNINAKTFETFMANIMLKLNAADEKEIIQIAKKQKYISG